MRNTKQFVAHYFAWNRKEFLATIAYNVVFGLLFLLFNFYELIEMVIVFGLAIKSFIFITHASISPGVRSTNSTFSWKYFQSLPIDRGQMLLGFAAIRFITAIPLFVWSLAFLPFIIKTFEISKSIELSEIVRIYLTLFIFIASMGVSSISQTIAFPRRQFQELYSKERTIIALRTIAVLGFCLVYFAIISDLVKDHFDVNLWLIFEYLTMGIKLVITTWLLPIVALLLGVIGYHRTLRIWKKESLSFPTMNFNGRREFLIISICLLLLAIPFLSVDMTTPQKYTGHPILQSVYNNDVIGVKGYLNDGEALNYTNKSGYNAHLVAVKEGNIGLLQILHRARPFYFSPSVYYKDKEHKRVWSALALSVANKDRTMVEYLLSIGAPINIGIASRKMTPLHLALQSCDAPMINLLIDRGANLEAKESLSKTPMHYAAGYKCFAGIVLLRDAGAKIKSRDKLGNTPLDWSTQNKHTKSFAHQYLKKITADE